MGKGATRRAQKFHDFPRERPMDTAGQKKKQSTDKQRGEKMRTAQAKTQLKGPSSADGFGKQLWKKGRGRGGCGRPDKKKLRFGRRKGTAKPHELGRSSGVKATLGCFTLGGNGGGRLLYQGKGCRKSSYQARGKSLNKKAHFVGAAGLVLVRARKCPTRGRGGAGAIQGSGQVERNGRHRPANQLRPTELVVKKRGGGQGGKKISRRRYVGGRGGAEKKASPGRLSTQLGPLQRVGRDNLKGG